MKKSNVLIDDGINIDWSHSAQDYAVFRPGPPDSFYTKLAALGVGLKGQRILDLGTGTGVLARRFAQQGAIVSGTDIALGQIDQAKQLAKQQNLNVDFQVSPAEESPFADHVFDVITANQCWLYFDKAKAIKEVKRLLKPQGVLVTSHISWLPLQDAVAKASEDLILKYNPHWNAHSFNGFVAAIPQWAKNDFALVGMFNYDEGIPFTHETWRGRIRACRGVGPALSSERVQKFDEEHALLLKNNVPENFSVLHKIWAHILIPL